MVCPNCHSTDIVSIQGQNYCINCGQLVPGSAVPAPKPVAKPVTAEIKVAPKVKPVKPKLEPAPPAPKAEPTLAPAAIKSVAPIINHRRPMRLEPAPIGPKPKLTPAKESPKSPKLPTKVVPETAVSHQDSEQVKSAHTLDLRNAQPKTDKPAIPVKETHKPPVAPKPATKPVVETKADERPVPKLQPDRFGRILARSLGSLWTRDYWPYSLLVATLVALPVAVLAYLSGGTVVRQLQPLASTGWIGALQLFRRVSLTTTVSYQFNVVAAVTIGYILISEVAKNFSVGAMVFGSAKLADRRNLPVGKWTQIGLDTVWANFSLDILYVFLCLVSVVSVVGARVYMDMASLDSHIQAYIVYALAVIAGFIVIGLTIGRLLARNAIVLANFTAPAALWLGWRLFIRQFFRALGFGLTAAFINLVAAAAYTAMAIAIITRVNQITDQPWLGSGLASLYVFGSIIIFSLLFIFNVTYWQQSYRALVSRAMPRLATVLVASRQPQPASLSTRVALWLLPVVVAAGIFLAWRY